MRFSGLPVRTLILGLPAMLTLTSCEVLQELAKNLTKPSASIAGVHFADLDMKSISLLFDVDISNPYEVALPVLGLSYDIRSGDRGILSGLLEPSESIPAGGKSQLSVPAKIQFADVLSILSGVRPGQVIPYAADLGLNLDIPGAEDFSIPLGTTGELPIPTVPEVELLGVKMTTLTVTRAEAVIDLSILNTNDFGLDLNQLQYGLSLGGKRVAEAGVLSGASFDAGGSNSLKIPISFSPMDAGVALWNALKKNDIGYSLDGLLDVKTPFGQLDMPYASAGQTSLFR